MENQVTPKKPARYKRVKFHGDGMEYFKIWIVNLLLTVLTLGIYSAWGKVRIKKYINSSTSFDGARLGYHADPKKILKGRMIAVGLFLMYFVVSAINPLIGGLVGLVLTLLIPFFFIQSLRFNAFNTSYRNIRFSFRGKTKEAYQILLTIAKIPFAVGIITIVSGYFIQTNPEKALIAVGVIVLAQIASFIYVISKVSHFLDTGFKFIYKNLYYGQSQLSLKSNSDSISSEVVKPYLKNLAIGLVVFLGALFAPIILANFLPQMVLGLSKFLFVIILYYVVIKISLLVPYLIINYVWSRLRFQRGKTKSTLKLDEFVKVAFTNMILVSISFGLLYPYSKIRMLKLKLENKAILVENMDEFMAEITHNASAMGEEISDAFDFDFEIGL